MIMTNFDIPYKLGTENGPPFNSQDFANLPKPMRFEHTRVTPYAPWANNTVEHFMRNLAKVLKTSHIDDHNWKTILQRLLRYLQDRQQSICEDYQSTDRCQSAMSATKVKQTNIFIRSDTMHLHEDKR